jgi:hypothetical protein
MFKPITNTGNYIIVIPIILRSFSDFGDKSQFLPLTGLPPLTVYNSQRMDNILRLFSIGILKIGSFREPLDLLRKIDGLIKKTFVYLIGCADITEKTRSQSVSLD